jgi:hypothetical protein
MVSPIDHPVDKQGTLIFIADDGISTVATAATKSQVQQLLQRALNTWSDVPPKLMQFSDNIDKI